MVPEFRDQSPLLFLCGVCKTLGGRPVLRGVDLKMLAGEHVLLCGRNGSGKSTLLSIIAMRLRADSGTIQLRGEALRRIHLSEIGSLAHEPLMHVGLTVHDNLLWQARMLGISDAPGRVAVLLDEFGLVECADTLVGRLSFGQSRRAALCRALAADPSLLLLDEPLDGLDEQGREQVASILARRASAGGATLITTHEPEQFAEMATRKLMLVEGQIIPA